MEGFAQGLDGCDVRFLSIAKAFVQRICFIRSLHLPVSESSSLLGILTETKDGR